MRIAVLSGKGGTGKTLVSTSLACVAGESLYLDCDVEEPNGHLFLKAEAIQRKEVFVKFPKIIHEECTGCRACVDFCRYNAMAYVGGKVKVFNDVCHSCGGCALICPSNAIEEVDKAVGKIESGAFDEVMVHSGFMNMGESSGVPIIKALLDIAKGAESDVVIDCPPGSACIVMESIREADYCLLVAEPSIFGVHNLQMVHELVELFKIPYGVILNKCIEGQNPSEDYCQNKGVPIIGRIPYDSQLGQVNGEGGVVTRVIPDYRVFFESVFGRIREEVTKEVLG